MKKVLLAGVAAICLPVAVNAQDSNQTVPTPESGDAAEEGLIIVTATRRAEDAQDVPISLTAFSGDFLQDQKIDTITDVANYTPNFTLAASSQAANTRIQIRGIGSVGNTAVEPSVGVFIDGVYYPRPGAIVGNLVDVASFEILRGPQGTLFGRNTPVGALNISTRNPEFTPSGYADFGYGNYNAFDIGGAYGGPVSDTVAVRLAARYTDRDGFGRNLLTDEEIGETSNLTLRGKVLFEPTPSFSALITADYSKLESGGQVVELVNDTVTPRFIGTLNQLYGATPQTDDPLDFVVSQDHQDLLDDSQWGASLDLNYEFDSGIRIRSITAYREWESDVRESSLRIPADVLPRINDYSTETFSQEFQILSPEGQTIEWIAGLFYYDERYDAIEAFDAGAQFCIPTVFGVIFQRAIANGATPAQANAAATAQSTACSNSAQTNIVVSPFEQSLESFAGFAQATWNISDQFRLTGGLRYTSDSKEGSFTQELFNPFASLFRVPEDSSGLERDDSRLTYFASANYFPTSDIMLFATASSGFKSGGFNSQGAGNDLGAAGLRSFGPEDSRNFELGAKTELFNRALTFNITLFHTTIEDFQDRSFDGLNFVTRNAGELVSKGFEIDYVLRPIEQFTLSGGASYLDATFESYPLGSPLPGGTVPQDLAGTDKTFAPDWQFSNVARWEDYIGSDFRYFLRGEWLYTGEQNIGGNQNNNPQTIQGGYSLFNAGLGFGAADDSWTLDFYVKNIADKGYYSVFFDQPFGEQLGAVNAAAGTSVQRGVLVAPRTYGARLRFEF